MSIKTIGIAFLVIVILIFLTLLYACLLASKTSEMESERILEEHRKRRDEGERLKEAKMEVTQEQIEQAIRDCTWRRRLYDTDICAGEVAPCMRVIDAGKCEAMAKLFSSEKEQTE